MAPGAMQLARTPPPSSEIALVSATTPALEAAYAAEPRTPLSVAALSAATFTMRPSPRIRRSAARQQRKQDRRLMSFIFSNNSSGVCANGAPIQPPAQCTDPQMAPCCCRALSYAASTCASTERSACLRVRATTVAPLRRNRSTVAAPRFPEAPVTTTQRRSSVDMAGQSTQNGTADARPRSPVRRRGLRRAAGAHARLRGELPLRQARADGDSGADVSSGPLVGDLLLLVGVIAWAVYTAEGREVVGRLGAFPTIAWTLITGTVLYLPLGLGALRMPSYRADIARASTAAWWGGRVLDLDDQSRRIPALVLGPRPPRRRARGHFHEPAAARDRAARAALPRRAGDGGILRPAAVVMAGVLLAQWRATDG